MSKKTIILHILCEGQTEEAFAKGPLAQHLRSYGVTAVKPIILVTNRKKGIAGGSVRFSSFLKQLSYLRRQYRDSWQETHYFSSMLDYYALPVDFPGQDSVSHLQSLYDKVHYLEDALGQEVGNDHFIPYLQVHEFEALVFCGLAQLRHYLAESESAVKVLTKVLQEDYRGNPELIDGNYTTIPSRRLEEQFRKEGKSYKKPVMGKEITQAVGVERLKERCPHFSEWVSRLEQLGSL